MATEVWLLKKVWHKLVSFDFEHVLLFEGALSHSKSKGVRRDRLFALNVVVAVAEAVVDQ